jgi:hypothetical protein
VWGYVYDGATAIAAYFVEWTPGHAERAANFDLILGKWGEHTIATDRKAVSLAFRQRQNGPSFVVINAGDRPVGVSDLVGEALDRERVVRMPIAQTVFRLCDTIFLEDHRIAWLHEP